MRPAPRAPTISYGPRRVPFEGPSDVESAAQIHPHAPGQAAAISARERRAAREFSRKNASTRRGMRLARRCKMRFMKAADPRVTFAELQEWPDDGRRYELYD